MRSDVHEMKLTADAVTGLIKLNVENNAKAVDKQFVKAFLIAIGPLKMLKMKSVKSIPKDTLAFVKGNNIPKSN